MMVNAYCPLTAHEFSAVFGLWSDHLICSLPVHPALNVQPVPWCRNVL